MKKSKQNQAAVTDNPHAKRQVLSNRRARHEYSIEDTFDAGVALAGTEVKSIRAGQANLQDAFCKIEDGEAWLYNMYVAPFEHGTHWNLEPRRKRKLLLHRREIDIMKSRSEQKGLALIPLNLYFQHGYAKIELGLGRGKKLYDKRAAESERQSRRDMDRALRDRG